MNGRLLFGPTRDSFSRQLAQALAALKPARRLYRRMIGSLSADIWRRGQHWLTALRKCAPQGPELGDLNVITKPSHHHDGRK